jgi:small subunit ribosomal protein S10
MNNKISIKIRGFNKNSLERSTKNILDQAKDIVELKLMNLHTNKKKFTLLKSPHVNKEAREQFELTTYKKKIEVTGSIKELKKIILLVDHNMETDLTYDVTLER